MLGFNQKTVEVELTHYQGDHCILVKAYDNILAIFKDENDIQTYKGDECTYHELLRKLEMNGYKIKFL